MWKESKEVGGFSYNCVMGRRRTLTDAEEQQLSDNVDRLLDRFGTINNDMISNEAMEIIVNSSGIFYFYAGVGYMSLLCAYYVVLLCVDNDEEVVQPMLRVGGKDWLRKMKSRHANMHKVSTKRPMEVQRAMKNQPECTVPLYRMDFYAYGLAQIQRTIMSGYLVEGWGVVNGMVQRNVGSSVLAGIGIFML